MEQFFMGLIVFVIVAIVRRKDVFTFRWRSARDTWAAVGVGRWHSRSARPCCSWGRIRWRRR